ncbi:MAG: FAD-binding oxidoreductase [Rhodospirillales bacterium]|nr:FAD-binding oxidoreductase [Rhodospirillales bacterium]
MTNCPDVVVAGGGIIGCATAYFLAASDDFDGSVVVIERDPTYQSGAATRSLGGIRQQFTTPENIRMSMFGAEFARTAARTLAVDDVSCDVSFREQGYLLMASRADVAQLRQNWEVQRSLGAAVEWLAGGALTERFPWINWQGVDAAVFGSANEGWVDPYTLLMGFRRKAQSLGTRFLHGEITRLVREGDRVIGVETDAHGLIRGGVTVLAAGSRAGALAASIAVDLPVCPKKRYVYVYDCRDDLQHAPLTIDPTGVTFRPESGRYVATVSPARERDPDSDPLDFDMDYREWEETIWPTLAARVPAFEAVKLTGSWAGHYDFNVFDQNAILGPHPEVQGLLFCNGFSGHGLQQSPAAGRAVAELIAYGEYRSLDLSRFGFERIHRDQPIVEANIW